MTVQRLQNVRPRLADSDDDSGPDEQVFDPEQDEESEGDEDADLSENGSASEGGSEDEQDYEKQISNVSFGALKRAQDTLPRKRKRGSETTPDQEKKLEALRERLRKIKEEKSAAGPSENTKKDKSDQRGSKRARQTENDHSDEDKDSEDSDEGPSEEDAPSKSRSSKHAPAAQSSKRQVTRKRNVIDVPKRVMRDPRFDALRQPPTHPGNSEKAYSFLEDYQKSEIDELRAAMKKTKNEEEKDLLRRQAGSMENRLKAKAAKEREQAVIRKHRKEEREKVEQGKTPYYLKQKDIKEKALVEKFKGMKSKEREKLVEKRRKKEGQKEKKRMPQARRMAG